MTPTWPYPPVCLVAPLYPPATGGVERYVERLATGLRERGIGVEIACTDPGVPAASVEVRDGIPVHRFPTIRGDRLFYPSPHLARWLRRHAADYSLVHAHNLHTLVPLAGVWGARAGQTPIVLTPHWHGTGHTPARQVLHVPYRPVAGWVVREASAIIGNSVSEAELFRRDFGERLPITVIPEGIALPVTDARATVPDPASTPEVAQAGVPDPDGQTGWTTVLSVGRLESYKGVERIVRSLVHLPPTHRLVVVGQGPDGEAIGRAASDAGVTDRVLMLGRVPDEELRAWYERAALFVSLSMHESFGLAVLEAAASGVPVVASDIPAHRESTAFVPAGRITLVPGDSDGAAIAAAITVGLAQGRVDDRTGWALPSWDDLVERTVAIYQDILARG